MNSEVEKAKQIAAKPRWSQAAARREDEIQREKRQEKTEEPKFTSKNKHNLNSAAVIMKRTEDQDQPLHASKVKKTSPPISRDFRVTTEAVEEISPDVNPQSC